MGQALVLVEALAAALLLLAVAAAWTSNKPRSFLRWGLLVGLVLAVLLPAGFTVYGLKLLHGYGTVSLTSLVAMSFWTAGFLIGAVIVTWAALRAASSSPPATWSVRSLTVGFAAAAVLTAITLSNLDVAVKGQLAAVRVEAGAKALALAPVRLPGARDAAPIYRKAFALMTPQDQLPALLRARAPAWRSYDRSSFDASDRELREFLESQQRALTLLREAAAIPQCTFDRSWSEETSPLDPPLPELPQLRHAAIILAYDALSRASRGDGRGAADDIVAIFGMARHLHYPLLIDLLTAVAIEKTGAKALQDVLSLTALQPEYLARLKGGEAEPFRQRLRGIFTMEEAWGLAAFNLIATGQARGSPELNEQTPMDALGESLLASPVYRVFFLEDDLASYRRHLRTMRDLAGQPAPMALEGYDKLEYHIRATRGGGILAGLLIPAAFRCMCAAEDGDATRSLIQLGVAATAYKAKNNKYPAKLGDLVPGFIGEIPPDPYDGRPLRLQHADGGIVLYSIGRDRKDDSGRAGEEIEDLTFRLK